MQLFPVGKIYDFMGRRVLFIGISALLVLASLVLLVKPGPRLGTDFVGGTEVEVAFEKAVTSGQVRKAVQQSGFAAPDVIRVEDGNFKSRYLIRVQEVSTIDEKTQLLIEQRLCGGEKRPAECTHTATEVKFSPGGEKITARFDEAPDLDWVRGQMQGLPGIVLRSGEHNVFVQNARDHRVEIQLSSRGDQLMDGLRKQLGADVVPDRPLRTEWIGPKAGAQLRDAALKSVVIALFFIMVYVAVRFDMRFAPGGVIALIHDAVGTIGILIVLGKELNLTTVAAILTIIGFSVNDTVVVYDRVRENAARLRGASFSRLINVSISEMLSRTILTSFTVILVLLCFFIWGTGSLKDFALALIVGMVLGVYSSVYVALPLTEWLDHLFFKQVAKPKARRTAA